MSQIFKFPINYTHNHYAFNAGASPRIVDNKPNDNDYRTYSTASNLVFQTYGKTRADTTAITHIWIKSKNVTSYSATPVTGMGTGAGLTGQTIPPSQVINGFQHDLQPLTLNASEVELVITGTSPEIYEVMFLESIIDLENDYTDVRPQRRDIGSNIRENIRGNSFKVGGLSDRYKHSTFFEAIFLPTSPTNGDAFIRALEENDNFAFAEDFERWPDRVYPAYISSQIDIQYIGRLFNQRRVQFTIGEA